MGNERRSLADTGGDGVGRTVRGRREPDGHPRSMAASAAFRPPISSHGCRVLAAAQPHVTGGEVAEHDQRQQRCQRPSARTRTSRTSEPAARTISADSGKRAASCGCSWSVRSAITAWSAPVGRYPADHLVVVQLGHRRVPGRHLCVLVELGLPAHRGHGADPLGPPAHRDPIPEPGRKLLRGVLGLGHLGSEARAQLVDRGDGLLDIRRQRREQPRRLQRTEHRERQVAEGGTRLEPGGHPRRGDLVLGTELAELPARGDRDHPAAATHGLSRRRQRLRGVAGERGHEHQRVRPRVRGQDRRSIHLDGDGQPVPEGLSQDVAGHRGPAHAAEHDRSHIVDRGQSGRRPSGRIPRLHVGAEVRHRAQHVAGIERPQRRDVVEIDRRHGVVQGFSASSINITGMSSRTG